MKIKMNEKARVEEIMTIIMFSPRKIVDINTPSEHRIAEFLVKTGDAEIMSKKNYGRIAQIRGTYRAVV